VRFAALKDIDAPLDSSVAKSDAASTCWQSPARVILPPVVIRSDFYLSIVGFGRDSFSSEQICVPTPAVALASR